MKKRKVNKFFDLNKHTVANLTDYEQERVLGGEDRCELTQCIFSNSAVLFSSTAYVDTHSNVIPKYVTNWPCYVAPDTH